jgi:hypothetical protein
MKNPSSAQEGLGTANGCEHKPTIAHKPRKINLVDALSAAQLFLLGSATGLLLAVMLGGAK